MTTVFALVFFAQLASPYETKVFINLEDNFVVFARTIQGQVFAIDSIKSLDDYFAANLLYNNQKSLLEELKKDMVKQGGYASKGLIGTFEIPLPKGGFSEFMGETGKLDVGGYVKITMGGSQTFVSSIAGSQQPSFFPELEMKQEMAINLDGEVGDRMKVYIDHNSERIDDTQNKITVTYKGKEDEIIQEIEGGDTQLSIPGTAYTGDIPSHSGLFGIKSMAKVGPVDIVAIASNEQTSSQEMVIEGGIKSDTSIMWDNEYAKRQFFWLGLGPGETLLDLKVYIDDNNSLNNNDGITYYARAILDANDDNVPDDTMEYEEGYFTLQREPDNYTLYGLVLELNSGLSTDQYALGVWYRKLSNGDTVEVGIQPVTTGDTIQLKLICPRSMDTSSVTWKYYEQKNYYQVVSAGSKLDSLRVYYDPSDQQPQDRNAEGTTYNKLLGIDENNDELPDENTGVWLRDRGLLRFPQALPFVSSVLPEPDSEIYSNPYYMVGTGKYFLYKKTIEAKAIYDLPENVIGVKVYLNGQEQDSIKDYHVDYIEGKLEFRKPIPPTAQVRIVAEYAPFFSLSQKSLVGVRGSMQALGQGTLGSSFFYRTEGYPGVDHVGLREEPFNRMVFETDFALPVNLPAVTQAVDWLPLIQTETESKFNINFENAYSFSDLNSQGKVYLDDLESSTISDDATVTRILWVPSSKPAGLNDSNFVRQRLIWYNPQGNDRLQANDIYQDPLDPAEIAEVLKIIYRPDSLATFAGLTQYVFGKNLEETENLELVIKGNSGRIHVDLGTWINEDQLRRNAAGALQGIGQMQDEDRLSPPNSWTQQTEDTGLDGVFGDDDDNIAGDDGDDDYYTQDYSGGINGTERNEIWDSEDLDNNGSLNAKNEYYSYSLNLGDTLFQVDEENAGLQPGWKMYRVPIKDSLKWDSMVGQPDWHNIRYIRVWFDSAAEPETMLVYKLSLTGSRWKNRGVTGAFGVDTSEVFQITPVNTKTHPSYRSPTPIQYDPTTNQPKPEGGLEFVLKAIKNNHTCTVYRRTEEYEDYRAYDTLTFFLKSFRRDPRITMRIGTDSSNYYEYSTSYTNGTVGLAINGYRTFQIDMARFAELKKGRADDSSLVSDGTYSVRGKPSLAQNRFFEVSLTNADITPLSDTMWFNDIRLISPRNEVGQTMRSNGSFNLADFSNFTFAYDRSNGRFKRLSDTKDMSTQGQGENYAFGEDISLNKLLPESWGFVLPLGLSYRKSKQLPRYGTQADDIELNPLDQEREISTNVSRSYTLSVSKSNSKNWLMKNTLDRLSYGHDRTQTFSHSPQYVDTSENINHRASYTLDPKVSFKVVGQVFSVMPQNLSFSTMYSDNYPKSYYRSNIDSSWRHLQDIPRRRTLNSSFSTNYSPHSIVSTTFNFSQNRDSVMGRERIGQEVSRNQAFNGSITKSLVLVTPSLTFGNTYNEDYRFEIRDTFNYRNISNTVRYGATGTVDVKRVLKMITRLRDESKDSLQIAGSPSWVLKQVEQFVDYLQNPSLSFTRQKTSSYLQAYDRPSLQYQWGLQDSIPRSGYSPNSYPGRGMADNYGVNSGMNYRILSLSGGYNGQVQRIYLPSGGENRTTSNSYPNAMVRVSGIGALPVLKKYTQSSSVSSGYNQTNEYRYTIDDSTTLDSDSRMLSFTPLVNWQTNWLRGITSSTEVTYSETRGRQYDAGNVNESRTLSRGGTVSMGYTFSAPRGVNLPFLKGLKFNSNLTTNLSVGYNRTTSYAIDMETPVNNTTTLTTLIALTYNFSSSVNGGANFDYSQNRETVSNQDSKRVGVSVWANISF